MSKNNRYYVLMVVLLSALSVFAQGYSWDEDLHHRLLVDFNKTREQVKSYIERYIPNATDAQMDAWEKTGALESRTVDGKKWYFHNAAPNLFKIDDSCRQIKFQKDGLTQHQK